MQTAPAIDLSAIPAAQRAAVLALMETVAALTEITRRQEHLIAELNHALHGKRSEKLTEDERQLAFEDLSIALAEVEVQKEHLAARVGGHAATKLAPKRSGAFRTDPVRLQGSCCRNGPCANSHR